MNSPSMYHYAHQIPQHGRHLRGQTNRSRDPLEHGLYDNKLNESSIQ